MSKDNKHHHGCRILIVWPESQRIMGHPDAELATGFQSAYWVPAQVWEEYKDGRFEAIQENLRDREKTLSDIQNAIQALDVGHLVQAKINEMNVAEDEEE